jgi:hypothetical protein
MNLYLKIILMAVTAGLFLLLTLLPTWAMPARPAPAPGPAETAGLRATQLQAQQAITFTPVVTLFLPVALRPSVDSGPTTVEISRIVYDPDGVPDADGEYVEVRNSGPTASDLTGWTLRDAVNTIYTFPTFNLAAGATVRIWVKSGTDTSADLYWGRGGAVWNNGGDSATLSNSAGTVVDSCTYPGGAPGFVDC